MRDWQFATCNKIYLYDNTSTYTEKLILKEELIYIILICIVMGMFYECNLRWKRGGLQTDHLQGLILEGWLLDSYYSAVGQLLERPNLPFRTAFRPVNMGMAKHTDVRQWEANHSTFLGGGGGVEDFLVARIFFRFSPNFFSCLGLGCRIFFSKSSNPQALVSQMVRP